MSMYHVPVEEPEWPFEPEEETEAIGDLIAREPASKPCTCGLLPKGMEAPGPSGWCAACQAEYQAWLDLSEDEFLPLEEVLALTPMPPINQLHKLIRNERNAA